MKWDDIDNAIRFNLVETALRCPRTSDIPHIKRYLVHKYGVPDRMIGDILHYGDRRISISSVAQSVYYDKGSRVEKFYIGYEDGSDVEHLRFRDIDIVSNWYKVVKLWKSIGLSDSAVLKALVVDGNDIDQAIKIVNDYHQVDFAI